MRWVGAKEIELPTYDGLPYLASFLVEFEAKVIVLQRLYSLVFLLKATPTRWWVHIKNLYLNGHSVKDC